MDKVVIITGGSRGIGAATALLAAEGGYAVAVNYRGNSEQAEKVATTICNAGGMAMPIQADVSREDDVLRLFETAERELGPPTALVNNAGIIAGPAGRVDEITVDQLERAFGINIIGAFLCAREAVRRMSTRYGGKGGAIVNVSSAAARHGNPGEFVHYAATKGAMDTFTVGLAHEVAREGIRVNAVRPGLIDTEIHATSGNLDRIARIAPAVPMGRAGRVDEVAAAILWLLSSEASYVMGAILDVSAGR